MTPLRKWRKAKDISLADLARLLGTSIATVSRVERGEQWPSRGLLISISEITAGDITANDFIGASDAFSASPERAA